jgi:hypothetical protein
LPTVYFLIALLMSLQLPVGKNKQCLFTLNAIFLTSYAVTSYGDKLAQKAGWYRKIKLELIQCLSPCTMMIW